MKESLPNTKVSTKDQRTRAIQWVRDSWEAIPEAVVRNAWKKSGGYEYFVEENEEDEMAAAEDEIEAEAYHAANAAVVAEAANADKDLYNDGSDVEDSDEDEEDSDDEDFEADFEQYILV
jgi:hypothetical protein